MITLMHAQVTLTLALLMITVILKIGHFWAKDVEISLCLHFAISSSLICQINIPAALLSEAGASLWHFSYKEFRPFLIGK